MVWFVAGIQTIGRSFERYVLAVTHRPSRLVTPVSCEVLTRRSDQFNSEDTVSASDAIGDPDSVEALIFVGSVANELMFSKKSVIHQPCQCRLRSARTIGNADRAV